jgi:hypothetical protein
LAVLDHQLQVREPLAQDECVDAISFDTEVPLGCARAAVYWRRVMERVATAVRFSA